MRRLYRETPETQVVSLQNRVDALERRFPNPRLCCDMPAVRMTGSDFTAIDGAYYGLAQTLGADPSAFGVADMFEFFNDEADCTGAFSTKDVGTGIVFKICADEDCGDIIWMIAYDAGVVFANSIDTTTVTASLYLGTGVGAGLYSWEFETLEAVMASNISGIGTPTMRVTGTIPVTGGFLPGDEGTAGCIPSDLASRPTISPILLVEGANADVDSTWCYFTAVSMLTTTTIVS